MNKQIILNEQEYETILDILSISVEKLDSYVKKENEHRTSLDCHIMDSPKCDKSFKQLYSIFLHLDDDDLRYDIIKKLGVKYFDRFPDSILGDDLDF